MGLSFTLIIVQLFLLVSSSYESLEDDQQTLIAIKASLNDRRESLKDWSNQSSPAAICSWRGVACDANRVEVVGLNLSALALAGKIPAEVFGSLKSLMYLNLGDNNLTGSIPAEIGNWTSLVELRLGGNEFRVGSLPEQLCRLRNLRVLNLSEANLQGRIPECLGNLTELEELVLATNSLTGPLPESLSGLKKLQTLDVSSNIIKGPIPPVLGSLENLRELFLWQNSFSGRIPPQLGNLSLLHKFDVAKNSLEGELPPELSGLKSLKRFHVFMNLLTGEFPQWLADHPYAVDIGLTVNHFYGQIPQNLGVNSELEGMDLVLMENKLSGVIPEDIQHCPTLGRLRLEKNRLRGGINLNAPALNFARLNDNDLDGHLIIGGNMSALQELDLHSNRMTGSLPEELSSLKDLVRLDLSKNRFQGLIPRELGNLRKLERLDLSSNSLAEQIPASISNCSSLISLNLSRNNLTGNIFLTRMEKLNNLDVSHNQLEGHIPPALGQSIALENLDLSFNNLSGEVPAFCKRMETNIDGNPMLCWPKDCKNREDFKDLRPAFQRRTFDILVSTLSAVAFILILGCFLCYYQRVPAEDHKLEFEANWTITLFHTMEVELEDVLTCVKKNDKLTSHGRKNVYVGMLGNGIRVAVKEFQGYDNRFNDLEFQAEVMTLGNLRHRNIVKLLASCTNGEIHLLVYEYMPMGNLRELLHGKMSQSFNLSWDKRISIIGGVAEALAYLHHDYSPKVIHRDVKCENIFLSADLEPRLGDFGLAKLLSKRNIPSTTSKVAGTYGYIAPGKVTLKVDEKVDVYSFGMVMLEVITGKMATWRDHVEDLDLIEWVKLKPVQELAKEVGAEAGTYAIILDIALCCVSTSSNRRPTMRFVLKNLQLSTGVGLKEVKSTEQSAFTTINV